MNELILKVFCIFLLLCILSENYKIKSAKSNTYLGINKSLSNDALTDGNKSLTLVTKKLVCFYIFTKTFNPQVLEGLCTHINIGFFGINKMNNSLEITKEQIKVLSQIILLKEKSENLKIIIAVGGAGDMGFSSVVTNHTTRKMFIRSCMKIIKEFNIDGLDLDWEWPVIDTGNPKEKIKFVQLLHEIRVEFNKHKKKYLLSIDVSFAQTVIELGYYVNYIADYVDYVNVMCYDYHYFTKLFPFTGHNAPLFSRNNDLLSKSINQSISFWILNSMPREKIILGMPTYGHTFELTFSNQHSLVAPAKNFGSVGQNGFADYQQICKFLNRKGTTVVYDDISKVPYAYQFPEWISYDDEKSLANKADFILEEKLSGAMVFSVNTDDFNGTCKGDGIPLPLIRKIRNILLNEIM